MRRVTVAHGGFTTLGGCEVLAADLLMALRAMQIQAELICWGGSGRDGDLLLRELLKGGVRISWTPWRWGCRWGWPDQVMLLHQWARFTDAETLIFVKLLDPSVHRRLLSLRKRMILITPYRPAEIWKYKSPDHEILNSFQTVIVQAQAFENDLRELGYEGEVFVLPLPPPDVGEPSAWPSSSTMQVGFLGRLVPDKNLEYLINSFSSLREMGIAAHLHVFGDGSERDKLQNLSGRLGLAEQIEFHGSLARSGIPEAIDRCHLFAFSSRTEGQCLAALEVLARGRPVLGTSVGAFPEFLSGVLGSVAPFDSPPAFAVALRALAEPVLKGEITPADVQRAYKASFPRHQIIDQYIQILEGSNSNQLM
jgi:glycosyltransferase involved in cell wall biosynthesis